MTGSPVTSAYRALLDRLRASRWYLVRDDEVGGWAVATVDRPTSQQDVDAGDRTLFYAVFEELGRELVEQHDALRDVALGVEPDGGRLDETSRYRRPAALDAPPSTADAYRAWLDRRTVVEGTHRDVPRDAYDVQHATATVVSDDGDLAWLIVTLARDVDPLAGVQLVDGLRALRAVRGPVPS